MRQRITPSLSLTTVCLAAAMTAFADGAELPRQELTTQEAVRAPQSASETCPQIAASTSSENDQPTNIEKLLADLDPSSKLAANAVPALVAALRHAETSAPQRESIAMMLGRVGEPARAAIPVLIGILREFEPTTDTASAESRTDDKTCYWAMKSLGLFGVTAADSVPEVRRIMADDQTSSRLRVLAADVLGQIRSPASIGVLIEQLMQPRRDDSHEETVLRQVMIDGLALAGPLATGAVPALARATEDQHAAIRRKACQALGALGPRAEGGVGALLERLVLDDDAAVKDAAADAMARLGSVAIPVLVNLLESDDADLQWRAARSLGQMGSPAKSSTPELQLLLRSSDARVRIEAADALLKVSLDPRLVTATLVQELSGEDRQIRRRASQILIGIRQLPEGISEQLSALVESENSNASRSAAYVLRERNRQQDQ